jgi:hypothetical protein
MGTADAQNQFVPVYLERHLPALQGNHCTQRRSREARCPPPRSQRCCLRWRYSQQPGMPARSTMNVLLIPFAYWAFFGASVQPLVPCTIETLRGISSFAFPEENHVRRQRTPQSTSEGHKIFARDCSGNRSRERSTKAKSTHR